MINKALRIIFAFLLLSIIAASVIDYSNIPSIGLSAEGGAGLGYHFWGYLIAAVLSWIAFRNHNAWVISIIGLLLFVLGTGLEILQAYLPYRTFNPKDIAANILGLGAGFLCILIWRSIQKFKESRIST